MKKLFLSTAIVASLAVPSFALTDAELNSILAEVSAGCSVDVAGCSALLNQKIAALEASGLDASALAGAVASLFESASSGLNSSAGSPSAIGNQLAEMMNSTSSALSRTGAGSDALNSAVSRVAIGALTVVQDRSIDVQAIPLFVSGLQSVAGVSTDTKQFNTIIKIANTLSLGGLLNDVLDFLETLSSYSSPA